MDSIQLAKYGESIYPEMKVFYTRTIYTSQPTHIL